MDLVAMIAEVLTRLGATSDDGLMSAAARTAAVNTAVRRMEADLDVPDWLRTRETIVTSVGVGTYAPSGTWAKTVSLRVTTSDTWLTHVGFRALDEDYGRTNGEPVAWAQEGGLLYVRPVPDAVYSLEHRFLRTEPVLAGSDTPLLPARFHDALVEKACAIVARRTGLLDRAAIHDAEYLGWLKTMADEQTRATSPPRVRVHR